MIDWGYDGAFFWVTKNNMLFAHCLTREACFAILDLYYNDKS